MDNCAAAISVEVLFTLLFTLPASTLFITVQDEECIAEAVDLWIMLFLPSLFGALHRRNYCRLCYHGAIVRLSPIELVHGRDVASSLVWEPAIYDSYVLPCWLPRPL